MKKVKDIFIDTNIVKNFANPSDPEYKKLVDWLVYDNKKKPENNAHIVVSEKLLGEYFGSSSVAKSNSNIIAILKIMRKKLTNGETRVIKISTDKIKAFNKEYKIRDKKLKKIYSKLGKDKNHIPLVMLSCRKYALTYDQNFSKILKKFPGFKARVEERPEKLPYKNGKPNC